MTETSCLCGISACEGRALWQLGDYICISFIFIAFSLFSSRLFVLYDGWLSTAISQHSVVDFFQLCPMFAP